LIAKQIMTTLGMCSTAVSSAPASREVAATAATALVAKQIMTTMGMCSTAVSSSPASRAAATVATALVAKQIMSDTSSNAHFPSRLHDMLDGVEGTQQTAIVSWCPDGRSFQIQ